MNKSHKNIQKMSSCNNSHFGTFSLISLTIGSTISTLIVCCNCCDIHEGKKAMVKTLHIDPTDIKKAQHMKTNNRLHFDLAMVSKRKIEYLIKDVIFNFTKNCAQSKEKNTSQDFCW